MCVLALNWGRRERRRPGSPCLPSHTFACASSCRRRISPPASYSHDPHPSESASSVTSPMKVSQMVSLCWNRCPSPIFLALCWVASALKDGPSPASVWHKCSRWPKAKWWIWDSLLKRGSQLAIGRHFWPWCLTGSHRIKEVGGHELEKRWGRSPGCGDPRAPLREARVILSIAAIGRAPTVGCEL